MVTLIKKTKREKLNMLEGPLIPAFIRYALPIIFSSFLQILYNAADVAAVGNFGNRVDVAAVGATTIVVNIFLVAVVNIAVGSNVIAARAFGAEDSDFRRAYRCADSPGDQGTAADYEEPGGRR